MAFIVYWARLEQHDDPYSEGYVGISQNTLEERKRSHYKTARSNKRNNVHFHNALVKYGDAVIWETLHEDLSEEDAFYLEDGYRPDINIGWNTDKGGLKAVSPEWYADEANKEKHRQATAEATRKRIAEVDSPEARAARAREVWSDEEYRKSREGMSAGENNPQYGKFGKDHPAAGHTKTPEGLAAISAAHKGKKLTETQKKAISDARSEAIGVYDTDREEMYKRRCAGETPTEIAEDYPITASSVDRIIRNWWRDHDLPKPKPLDELNPDWRKYKKAEEPNAHRGSNARAAKFTDPQRKDMCKRRANGESFKAIGDRYGVGVSTIRTICKTWGPDNGYPFKKSY